MSEAVADILVAEYERPHMYRKQAAFVDDKARYTIIEASTKTGKTVACLIWLWEQAMHGEDGRNYWWVAPVFPVAAIAFKRLCRWLRSSGLPTDSWRANLTELTVSFAGRTIWFKGGDKPDSLYGEDVYACVIDESTRVKEDSWFAVRTTLTATRGPIKIIGNVKGKKNWAYRLAQMAKAGAKNTAYHKLTAWDAVDGGVLDREEVEDAQRLLPEAVFKELYLAEPSEDGANPFGISAIRACINQGLANGPATCYGVDLAKSHDWTVIIGLNAGGQVCEMQRWQGDWQATERKLIPIIGSTPALIDSTGVGDPIVERLQSQLPMVEGFKFSSQSKQQLMEGLASGIQRQDVRYPAGWLVDELESFEFEYSARGVKYSAPEGLHDDGVCALALAHRKRTLFGDTLPFSVTTQRTPEAGEFQGFDDYARGAAAHGFNVTSFDEDA